MLIILVIVAAIVVAIVVIKMRRKLKAKSTVAENPNEKKIELDKQADSNSSTHFSDEFKSGEPITTINRNHTITTILVNKEDSFMWVCPSCETENPPSKQKCCVCHYAR